MKRLFGLLIASLAIVVGVLGVFGMPPVFAGSGAAVASAAAPAQQIGMKILLITDSANANAAISYGDWVNTLQREGVPYDTVTTNSSRPGSVALPALSSTAANGTQIANYQGVVVMLSGLMGLSDNQWATLQTFEHQFSVRQVTAYAVPSSDYGLTAPNPAGGAALPPGTALTLTAAAKNVFPYLNAASVDPTQSTWAYEGRPVAGQNVDPLLTGPGGSTLLGIYTTPDGRQTMFQTFNENQYYLQSQLLRHGELDWLARNTYFGDQRNYLETDVDDNFLSDDSYTPGTGVGGGSTDYNPADALRETSTDVTTAANWSAANNLRIDMLFNGGGSSQYIADHGSDPLLAAFQADKADFGWINHTWDHPNIDQGCADETFIDSEITQNTDWGTTTLGLGTSSTSPLGNQDPGAVVTGEHSGLANLLPGNPGTVDPPEFDAVTPVTPVTATTFVAGNYTYAITDDFVAGGGQSSASETTATLAAGQSVDISWEAVCHAADYYIYRLDPGATTWTLVHSQAASAGDFTDTGPQELSFTDTDVGSPAASAPSATVNQATESPYEQNTSLTAAFAAIGIKDFGSDASKPYPNPATATFATGTTPASEFPAGSTFQDGGAAAIPRYPTNIYYNASTEAQEVNEYETIYDLPTCLAITGITTCNPAGTVFTMSQIVASVDQNMFSHMMGNDPRPHYFHQTNLMGPSTTVAATGTPPATSPTVGDGLYYETINPLLAEYHQYFAGNAPIEQLTMAQIGTLLNEQATWLQNHSPVSGNIEGNVVTLHNSGAPINVPLTGTNIGSPYAGTQSGWTLVPTGTSTYKALAAWPAEPTGRVIVTVPSGPAPGFKAQAVKYVVVQVAPKTVRMKKGKVTVSLKCEATRGKTQKGKVCAGKFTMKVKGVKRMLTHKFRIKTGKVYRISIKVPNVAHAASKSEHKHPKHKRPVYKASLVISTNQSHAKPLIKRGTLKIKT